MSSAGGCPLSQAQVNAAFGFSVPQFEWPESAYVLCTFNRLGDKTLDNPGNDEPQVLVGLYAEESTPSSVREEEEEVDVTVNGAQDATGEFLEKPEWGKGAGVNLNYAGPKSEYPGASASILLPEMQMIVEYPEASLDVLRATALRLGAAAAD